MKDKPIRGTVSNGPKKKPGKERKKSTKYILRTCICNIRFDRHWGDVTRTPRMKTGNMKLDARLAGVEGKGD